MLGFYAVKVKEIILVQQWVAKMFTGQGIKGDKLCLNIGICFQMS